jgi:hypothetical protein
MWGVSLLFALCSGGLLWWRIRTGRIDQLAFGAHLYMGVVVALVTLGLMLTRNPLLSITLGSGLAVLLAYAGTRGIVVWARYKSRRLTPKK